MVDSETTGCRDDVRSVTARMPDEGSETVGWPMGEDGRSVTGLGPETAAWSPEDRVSSRTVLEEDGRPWAACGSERSARRDESEPVACGLAPCVTSAPADCDEVDAFIGHEA